MPTLSAPSMQVTPGVKAPLDPAFQPAALWNRAYRERTKQTGAEPLAMVLERANGNVSVFRTEILPAADAHQSLNRFYTERLLKFLLWQKGGCRVTLAGDAEIAAHLASVYSPAGNRQFDADFMGNRVYGTRFEVFSSAAAAAPLEREITSPLGRHRDGCRIGFDLGGSDRKCAAMMDGAVVFSEEIAWNPYFESDPDYHYRGIRDSLERAAAHLPRVDAIGGSAAGVYVDSEVRVASIFRGVAPELFDSAVRPIFSRLAKEWENIPFIVVNDGEVAALAGSMSLRENAVLGISMGTSLAAGYVTPEGNITDWLNELAFAPIDYAPQAAVDEWSGDAGVGAQYLSQQAVARLLPLAEIPVPEGMPFAEQLILTQELMAEGDDRASRIYQTVGVYFGYALAHYADFYDFRHVLTMGRVTTGAGGAVILDTAKRVLARDFPERAERIQLHLPGEGDKRHGQAAAAATLPLIPKTL